MKYYWETQGYYGQDYGWEMVTTDDTRDMALVSVQTYRENESDVPFRIRRVKVEG